MKERLLKQHIDNCTDKVQEYIDLESAQAISSFQKKASENFHRLDQLKQQYSTKEIDIEEYRALKAQHNEKLNQLEKSIEYYEKLAFR